MQMRETLHERFPQAFMAKGQVKKPLAVGIREQVLTVAPDLERKYVTYAISNYVLGRKYQESMVAGAQRVNIDGSPAVLVTEQDAGYARLVLQRLEQRWAQRDRLQEYKRKQKLSMKASHEANPAQHDQATVA